MKQQMRLTICLVILMSGALTAAAQTSTFTYQGRLTESSMPASGAYLMEFQLHSTLTGGTAIETRSDVPVTVANGVFTVELNFTAEAFDGELRYLEIRVKRTAGETYTTLAPRQFITSAPYAIHARKAGTADTAINALNVGGAPAADIIKEGDTRLTDERTPTAGSSNYVQNTSAQQTGTTNFNISGNGTASGTLSGGVVNSASGFNIGGARVLSVAGTDNIFAGENAGKDTSGYRNSFFGKGAGQFSTSGDFNSFVGAEAGFYTTGRGNSFVGEFTGYAVSTGSHNSFFGRSAGNDCAFFTSCTSFTTGDRNSALGYEAGSLITTGSDNTLIGSKANVGAGNLNFATAIGAGAVASRNNSITLGRADGSDTVLAAGHFELGLDLRVGRLLAVNLLGSAGSESVCRNSSSKVLSACSSSLRYKTNIAPFTFGINFIKQLRPISYDWKSGGKADVGFGAEDVARINPLFVTYNTKGEVEGVKYDRLSTVLVNAIKEQQTQIETQAAQIEQQQQQIEELRRVVCAIKPDAASCQKEERR